MVDDELAELRRRKMEQMQRQAMDQQAMGFGQRHGSGVRLYGTRGSRHCGAERLPKHDAPRAPVN